MGSVIVTFAIFGVVFASIILLMGVFWVVDYFKELYEKRQRLIEAVTSLEIRMNNLENKKRANK